MASFTDKIPQFNPYIQQLPIDAMVQVGMQKQAQYDAGVQKIQAQIDNVAGLDVTSKHKQYLESRLNELGNNLKTVAAGDFSNFQLVNSVGGMVKQLTKDSVIQNAVYSTKMLRDQQAIQKKAKQQGKSSVQNDDDLTDKINGWLSDGDLNSVFTEEYVPYTNIDEKLRKVGEKLKEEKNSVDIPWKTDDQGNVLFFKKDTNGKIVSASTDPSSGGEKELDISMQRIKTSGITAQRLLNNFMSSLTENDKRQLMIDAKYNYRGVTTQTLKNDLYSTVSSQKKMLHENLVDIAVELERNDKLTPEQRQAYEAAIADGNAKLSDGTFEKIYAQGIVGIDNISDLNKYKYQIYTEKTLTNLAKDMQLINREQQILNNPIYRALFDQQKFKFQVEKSEAQLKIQNARLAIAQRNQLLREEQWAVKLKEKRAKAEEDAEIDTPITTSLMGDSKDYRVSSQTLKADARNEMLLSVGNLNNEYGSRIFSTTKGQQAQKDALDKLYLDYLDNPTKLQNSDALTYIRQRKAIEANYDNAANLGSAAEKYANTQLARLGPLAPNVLNEKRAEYEADYISERLAQQAGSKYAGLNPEGKATKRELKSIIGNKLQQLLLNQDMGEGAIVSQGGLAEMSTNLEKSVPTIVRNDDGSGVLTLTLVTGEGKNKTTKSQTIPLSPQEMYKHFPRFSVTNPYKDMKKSALQTGTTNSFGTRNAGGARIFGFDVPGLVGTDFENNVRLDFEAHKDNNGRSFDRFKVIMYSFKNGIWKPGELSDYVSEDLLQGIVNGIGPNTVQQFNQKK